MSKKAKPKWGWYDAGFYSPFPFSDDNFDKIKKKMPNVDGLTEDIRSQLQEAAIKYCIESDRILKNPPPRLSEVRAALTEIHGKTETLIECLKQIDTISLGQLYGEAFPDNLELLKRIENKSSDIHKLHSIAQETLNRLKQDRGGRPIIKQPLRGLICHLICIYESSTGTNATLSLDQYEEKYKGKFYEFTHTVIEIIDPEEIWSNSSLGQQIKAAIKLLNPSDKNETDIAKDKEQILQSLQRMPTIKD